MPRHGWGDRRGALCTEFTLGIIIIIGLLLPEGFLKDHILASVEKKKKRVNFCRSIWCKWMCVGCWIVIQIW
jgi:hypothetical protein